MKLTILLAIVFLLRRAHSAVSSQSSRNWQPAAGARAAGKQRVDELALLRSRPGAHTCKQLYFDKQRVDHFNARRQPRFWSQRYLLNDSYWESRGHKGPILFYAGNEAAVEAYVDWCGLMWENAAALGALLVWAEHRYYGQSQPLGKGSVKKDASLLSVQQAMMDYVTLVQHLKQSLGAESSPVIVLGGSYGGMLAAWLRQRYSHVFTGAIAASAPVGAFVDFSQGKRLSPFVPSSFWEVVTQDALPDAGAAEGCADNTARVFQRLFELGGSSKGRQHLSDAFQLCDPLDREQDTETLANWIQGAFDSFAMGNYHFPSNYIGGTREHPLPAWPMRKACLALAGELKGDRELLRGMKGAVDVLYNVTRDVQCHKLQLTGPSGGPALDAWLWLWCSQAMPQEMPYFPARGPPHDMFWDQGPFNRSRWEAECQQRWGVRQDWGQMLSEFGGVSAEAWQAVTNIIWTNGWLDPWHTGGILQSFSESNVALLLPEGAHHVDTMWSRTDDPPLLTAVRRQQVKAMRQWAGQHYQQQGLEWAFAVEALSGGVAYA